jgi:hypothetical protein
VDGGDPNGLVFISGTSLVSSAADPTSFVAGFLFLYGKDFGRIFHRATDRSAGIAADGIGRWVSVAGDAIGRRRNRDS